MAHSATTRGLRDLATLRSRIARDYGMGKIAWGDFEFINDHLQAIETRLLEIVANDPSRLSLEEQHDKPA